MSRVAQLPQAIAGRANPMAHADLQDTAERWVVLPRAGRVKAMLLPRPAFPGRATLRAGERAGRETTREGEDCYRRGSYKSDGRVCIGLSARAVSRLAVSIFSRAIERAGQDLAGERLFYARDLLGRALCDDAAAFVAAFGTEVNDPVGLFDDVEMVLDNQHGVAERDEAVQHVEQFLHVVKVQPGGWLVENIQRAAGLAARKFAG